MIPILLPPPCPPPLPSSSWFSSSPSPSPPLPSFLSPFLCYSSFPFPLDLFLSKELRKTILTHFSYFHDDWRVGLLAQNLETGSTFSHSHSLIYESLRKSRALPLFPSLFNKTKTTGKSSLSYKRG